MLRLRFFHWLEQEDLVLAAGFFREGEGRRHSGFIALDEISDTVVAATTHLRLDQLDHPVFPSKGYQINLDGMFASEDLGSSETFSKLELKAQLPLTIGVHTITPKLALGSSLGTDLPFYASFDVGGLDSFAGYAPHQLRGNYYGALVGLGADTIVGICTIAVGKAESTTTRFYFSIGNIF